MDMIQVGCEESISAADEAQMEHERGEREREERERWGSLEVEHGPLMTQVEWDDHVIAFNDWIDRYQQGEGEDWYAEYEGKAWKD